MMILKYPLHHHSLGRGAVVQVPPAGDRQGLLAYPAPGWMGGSWSSWRCRGTVGWVALAMKSDDNSWRIDGQLMEHDGM